MYNYEIILYFSKADLCFVAEIPELNGCIAHGETEYDAIKNVNEAKELWLETAKEFKVVIPEPKGRLVFA